MNPDIDFQDMTRMRRKIPQRESERSAGTA
ncbi:unnamed protein product [Gulo gulo]|uniref:Uncharacterized protein n=1 Tax=Gulo gulo TaxID=48420 RepID=A0A9X9M0U8_GULGU|nr:unnamed protein product [Gulo gulo]